MDRWGKGRRDKCAILNRCRPGPQGLAFSFGLRDSEQSHSRMGTIGRLFRTLSNCEQSAICHGCKLVFNEQDVENYAAHGRLFP
jgi:hypothetical protein